MSQKINPINFRLGLFQVWNNDTTSYGKTNFQKFHQRLQCENYAKNLLLDARLLPNSFNWSFWEKNALLIMTCSALSNEKGSLHDLRNKLVNVFQKIMQRNVELYFLKYPFHLNSAKLLTVYAETLLSRKVGLKYILKYIHSLAIKQLRDKKVIVTSKGVTVLKLQGIKIKSKGRFENTRNQMSKTTKFTEGSSSLPKLKSYVEYSQTDLYTKSGICSLHVWLFYTII